MNEDNVFKILKDKHNTIIKKKVKMMGHNLE